MRCSAVFASRPGGAFAGWSPRRLRWNTGCALPASMPARRQQEFPSELVGQANRFGQAGGCFNDTLRVRGEGHPVPLGHPVAVVIGWRLRGLVADRGHAPTTARVPASLGAVTPIGVANHDNEPGRNRYSGPQTLPFPSRGIPHPATTRLSLRSFCRSAIGLPRTIRRGSDAGRRDEDRHPVRRARTLHVMFRHLADERDTSMSRPERSGVVSKSSTRSLRRTTWPCRMASRRRQRAGPTSYRSRGLP